MPHHPSTQLALQALNLLNERPFEPEKAFDLGCGSGTLSFAMAEFWPDCRIFAADISPAAVADCTEAAQRRGLENVEIMRSDGFSHSRLAKEAPYSLIICNLLAEPLLRLAPVLAKALSPGGYLILSGLLAWHLPLVLQTYGSLEHLESLELREWNAGIWRKA